MFRRTALSALLLSSIAAAALSGPAMAETPAPFHFKSAAPAEATSLPTLGPGQIRRIAASRYDMFFGGEFASRKLAFFALPDEASSSTKLVLTAQTAISAAPERSRMIVKINGTEVGTAALVAGDPRRMEFDVPAGVVQPGYNAVSMEVDHRHRVDCSIEATYELWTQVDPAQSGFIFNAAPRTALSLVDLMPVSGTADGRTNLRVVLPAGAQMADFDRALKAVQALTILGHFDHPQVEFADKVGTGPGIDLVIGTKSAIAPLVGPASPALSSADPVTVEPGATAERRRLVLTGADAGEINARLAQFIQLAGAEQPVGTPEGLAALANTRGRLLTPGEKVTLSELGYSTKRFDGRYTSNQVNFTMPSDFYPGDYASMYFHMSALYVGGLAPDAALTVKANDKVVATISLSSAREGAIRDQRLPIPFNVLRPGQNTLKIEARLPSRLDAACESVDKASPTVRLAIDENSYLDMQNYARIGRYPDIGVLTSGLTRMAETGSEPTTYLLVPGFDRRAINAAATFTAKMAYASNQVKPLQYTSILPPLDASNVMAFGAYDTLPSELTGRMNLDFVNMRTTSNIKASPLEVAALQTTAIRSDATDSLMASSLQQVDSLGGMFSGPVATATRIAGQLRSKIHDAADKLDVSRLRVMVGADTGEQRFSPATNAAVVVAQDVGRQGGLWTVVAARNMDSLAARTDTLTDANLWNKLGGAVQSFSETGEMLQQHISPREQLFQTQPLTLSNARLVAASWLANNAALYIAALLISAILLGIGTYMVLVSGRRPHA
ncbi:hypothetical protein BJF93_20725 [Xaviernesmea oryzae]|uniref:Cyclic di-GMP-binding protein n=1 Tax=Xaviernesmea oryzae TaxID=464029 RepID=A0A1Q9AZS8_9HYPH|nr:cellulose biosynthesis cyclic di-GMP-binding regulatory protein BcsB [Xaviernesmea oryzae]OLP61219.1 hypothetical protein BJF93_20725 [Xaviernesmea oryzae]SEL50730.1 cellulose synthase subunit [Xaviernesmea oryzae]